MINIENIDDNEWFKWSIVRYLNPADCNPARITKADKEFANKLDFKDIKFPEKIIDIHKIKKRILSILVSLVMKIKKNIQSMYHKKGCEEKHVDLLLLRKEGKRQYVLIKVYNTYMYDDSLHHGRKHFYYCLQAFSTEEILKVILKTALKLMANKEL